MQADPKAALFMMIVVDGIAVILTLGGLTVIALAARPRRTLIIASALCGSLCGLLIAAAPATAGTAVTSVLGLVLGGVAGVLVGLLLATLLSIGTGRLAFMGALG